MKFWKKKVKDSDGKEIDNKSKIIIPTLEITQEREEEILDYITEQIAKFGLDVPALLFLFPIAPLSPVLSQLGLLPLAPFLEAFNIHGFDYVAFFSKTENVNRIIKKIEEKNLKKEEKEKNISSNENG
jgi:hypothetical protein